MELVTETKVVGDAIYSYANVLANLDDTGRELYTFNRSDLLHYIALLEWDFSNGKNTNREKDLVDHP